MDNLNVLRMYIYRFTEQENGLDFAKAVSSPSISSRKEDWWLDNYICMLTHICTDDGEGFILEWAAVKVVQMGGCYWASSITGAQGTWMASKSMEIAFLCPFHIISEIQMIIEVL